MSTPSDGSAATSGPRYAPLVEPVMVYCEDCGVPVADEAAHTRFHSILSSHAWVLAILKNTHLSATTHDRYDSTERIDRRRFDNWSADALAEVMEGMPDGES